MQILIPVLGFASEGGYRVLSELANAWRRLGHRTAFLSPDSSKAPYFPTTADILWANAKGAVSTRRDTVAAPSARYHLSALYRGLGSIGRDYDIVLANHSLTAWPVALARCGAARKFYYVQAYEPEFYAESPSIKRYFLAALSAASYHLPLRRVVNSPVYLRYRNLSASDCVPPGIDLQIFHSRDRPADLRSADTIRIGCIGRREPGKGTLYVLRAFEQLHKQDSRYALKVAYGNLPDGWRHDRCEVVVPTNDPELSAFYRNVDILVAVPTIQQGAPHYPVLEAWASGATVVTTGYMGATPDNAWLVENKNVNSICSAIAQAVADAEERQAKIEQGYRRARSHSWDSVASDMIALFTRSQQAAEQRRKPL